MVRLGDVCQIIGGYAFKSEEFIADGVPVIRISNLDGNNVNVDENVCYPVEFLKNNDNYIVRKNDILMAMSGATVGKIGVYQNEFVALLNQRVCNLKPFEDKLHREYLYFYCQSDYFKSEILKNAFGCAQPNISVKQIADFEIKILDLELQVRIADKLKNVSCLIEKRKQQLQKLDELVKARFVEMFGDVKTNDKKWCQGILSEHFVVKGGKRIPKGMGYSDSITRHPYLRTTDMKNSTIIDDDIHYIDEDVFQKIKRYTVNAGDIYLTNVGVNLGMAGTIPKRYDGANLTENAVKLIPKDNKFNGDFLAFYLNSSGIQDYINERKMSVGVPKLAIFRIETMPLVVPPLEIQNQFATFVEQIDKSKLYVQKSLEKLEMLKKSLMQKHFW